MTTQVAFRPTNTYSSYNLVSRTSKTNNNFLINYKKTSDLYDVNTDPFIHFFKYIYYQTNFHDFQQVYFKIQDLKDHTLNCLSDIQIYINEHLLDQVSHCIDNYEHYVNEIFNEFIPKLESFRDFGNLSNHHHDITTNIMETYNMKNITSTRTQIITSLQIIWTQRFNVIRNLFKIAEKENYNSKYYKKDIFAIQEYDNSILSITEGKPTWRDNDGSSEALAITEEPVESLVMIGRTIENESDNIADNKEKMYEPTPTNATQSKNVWNMCDPENPKEIEDPKEKSKSSFDWLTNLRWPSFTKFEKKKKPTVYFDTKIEGNKIEGDDKEKFQNDCNPYYRQFKEEREKKKNNKKKMMKYYSRLKKNL